ncbi:MAG: hypothetical protein HY774_13610 [Acidobacteria bacterium]|nr:hypothetical protein [Acidobacteriota bacterium]
MTFRLPSTIILKRKKWHQFCLENQALIDATGLPMIVFETWEHFEDFLMHGYLDHHLDPTSATIEVLTNDQQQALYLLKHRFEANWYA